MSWINTAAADYGPAYNIDSASLAKFRRAARNGPLLSFDKSYRNAYADAVRAAVLAAQRSSLRRERPAVPANCASGTFHSDGEAIHRAVKAQQRAALARLAAKDRNKTPEQWQEQYEQAMKEKRRKRK